MSSFLGGFLVFFFIGNLWKQVWPISETSLIGFLGFVMSQSLRDSSDLPLLVWDQISANTFATPLGMDKSATMAGKIHVPLRLILKAS
jgi:hypothetical protein